MSDIRIEPCQKLLGSPEIPGDKSISHRAAILGLLAPGKSRITNFLTADDCLNTLKACEALGARVEQHGQEVVIRGCGLKGLSQPGGPIDCGNSGTGVRLLSGVLAAQPFVSVITGDDQVRRRPMRRIIEPLQQMGATIESQTGQLCPLRIHGGRLHAVAYRAPVASAQVKSCVLLAGLCSEGETKVILPAPSRDHMERLLTYFGSPVRTGFIMDTVPGHWTQSPGEWVMVQGGVELQAREVQVPGDISSAAFFIVAACLLPGSQLTLRRIGVNPTRVGILEVLKKMGADIALEHVREISGEPVADIRVRGAGRLAGTTISGESLIPRLIDELPVLAVAAAAADGETTIKDAAELRVKESGKMKLS